MNERERLIELLKGVSCCYAPCDGDCGPCKNVELFDGDLETMADHLIANGVTVLECGHWKIIMDDYACEMMCCSVCGSEFYDGDNDTVDCLHNYCPNCGAKMMPLPEAPKEE